MKMRSTLIVFLLALFMTAPIFDAIACDDCSNFISPGDTTQRIQNASGQPDNREPSSDSAKRDSAAGVAAQELCPVCANIAAAMGMACCSAPSIVRESNHQPKLLASIDPSYSINKPPQI